MNSQHSFNFCKTLGRYERLDRQLEKKIQFAISQLEDHIEKSIILVKKCHVCEPDYVELCAIGSILHAYYNGIENILLLIRKGIDEIVPEGGKWHSDLLLSMFEQTNKRSFVFSENLKDSLLDYMNFRHFFRHSYGYNLKWEKAAPLFLNLDKNWKIIKESLNNFILKYTSQKDSEDEV